MTAYIFVYNRWKLKELLSQMLHVNLITRIVTTENGQLHKFIFVTQWPDQQLSYIKWM